MTRTFTVIALTGALALAALGCGSSSSSNGSSESGGGSESQTSGSGGAYGGGSQTSGSAGGVAAPRLQARGAHRNDAGPRQGHRRQESFTVYDFHKDKGTQSSCYGACEKVWPPVTTEGGPQPGNGAQASKLGTTKRKDGTVQVTYAGHPLYTYVADRSPATPGQRLQRSSGPSGMR